MTETNQNSMQLDNIEVKIEERSDVGSEHESVSGVIRDSSDGGKVTEFRLHGGFELPGSGGFIFNANDGGRLEDKNKWKADLTLPVNFQLMDNEYARNILGEEGEYELAKNIAKKVTDKYRE